MRRIVFFMLGILELLSAVVLISFAWQLPGRPEVENTVGRAERVTRNTSEQVRRLREQLDILRARQPQMQALALRLQQEMRAVNDQLQSQQIDYNTVKAVSDSLGDAAAGLDGLSDTLDPKGMEQFARGLKAAADFLEKEVGPAAALAADELDKTTDSLRADAQRLNVVLKTAPPDLKAVREIHDSLVKFDQGLERMQGLLKAERIGVLREGFQGLGQSLNTGAGQVERLAGYSYPVVTFNGLKPSIEQRAFWPEGGKIAEGMRKAAEGTAAGAEELALLSKDLPQLRQSLQESRRAASVTRDALATALKQQDKVEALLQSVPRHTARLAEQLPALSSALSKVLRETSHLKEIGNLLGQTQKAIETAVQRWPELRKNLGRSSVLLRATQAQLTNVLTHREDYEASLRNTLMLSRTFSAALPLLSEQLEMGLDDQEQALANLGDSIDDINTALPGCADTASNILRMTRLLLALMAAVFALHGGYLLLSARLGRRYSI